MFKAHSSLWASSICLLLAATFCAADDTSKPNPEYVAWKSFKVGTFVRYSRTTNGKIDEYVTAKLLAVTEEAVKVEYGGTNVQDNNSKTEPKVVEIRAKTAVEPGAATQPSSQPANSKAPKIVAEGEEDIEVAGRKVHAHWTMTADQLYEGPKNKIPSIATVWTSAEIPGALVKGKHQWGDNLRETKLVEIKEP